MPDWLLWVTMGVTRFTCLVSRWLNLSVPNWLLWVTMGVTRFTCLVSRWLNLSVPNWLLWVTMGVTRFTCLVSRWWNLFVPDWLLGVTNRFNEPEGNWYSMMICSIKLSICLKWVIIYLLIYEKWHTTKSKSHMLDILMGLVFFLLRYSKNWKPTFQIR